MTKRSNRERYDIYGNVNDQTSIIYLSEESTRIIQVEMQMNQSWHVSHLGDSSDCIIICPVTQ